MKTENSDLEIKIREIKRAGKLATALAVVGFGSLFAGVVDLARIHVTKTHYAQAKYEEITREFIQGTIDEESRDYTIRKMKEFVDERTKTDYGPFEYAAIAIPLGIWARKRADRAIKILQSDG